VRIDVSSSERRTHLTVRRGSPTLEIEVLDSNFEPAGAGVGEIDVLLDPGLYEIRFREGSSYENRLVKVELGPNAVEPPHFQPASPAPVEQTSTTHEYHQEPVLQASGNIERDCAAPGPETGGILVMVRNVRGQDELPFPPDLSRQFSILNAQLEPLDPHGDAWQGDRQAGWALWSRAVLPGGYAMRIEDGEPDSEVLLQSLWVDEGWQTMLFVPNTPDGPAAELATVHVVRVGQWSPWDEGSTVAVALESVLEGLRTGRSVVPDDLGQLFHAKFVNPFLGIAAAHALLLDPRPSLAQLQTVVGNLERLLPQNPDVIALAHRATAAGATVQATESVVWPPMMYIGYRALLRADAARPGVITDGSAAEDAAARVRISGLWTTWAAEEASFGSRARDIGEAIGLVSEEPNPATERLLAYVDGAAEIHGKRPAEILNQKSMKQLALATGLPSATVRSAVDKLKADLQ
jgi:hypothetical protein